MRTELVGDALRAGACDRGSLAGAIFHSEHGSVYASKAYAKLCEQLQVTQSMGVVGTSADNSLAESLNAALKRELLAGESVFPDHAMRIGPCSDGRAATTPADATQRSANITPNTYAATTSATLTEAA
ncbi:hypothetical protein GCM10010401_16920 [Rarobacter faecitabidus]